MKNAPGLPERYRNYLEGDSLDIVMRMLDMNPDTRITARQALDHPYFAECRARDNRQPRPARGSGDHDRENSVDEVTRNNCRISTRSSENISKRATRDQGKETTSG